MSDVNWSRSPTGAQAWAPETTKFMAGFYKKDEMGRWYYATSRNSGWWKIDTPSSYRRKQMEQRPTEPTE